jgi:hypothetical protein
MCAARKSQPRDERLKPGIVPHNIETRLGVGVHHHPALVEKSGQPVKPPVEIS